MGSSGLSLASSRLMPFLAILRHDLRSLLGSWLVRLWLVGSVLLTVLLCMGTLPHFRTAPLIALLMHPYLVIPWFLVVMVLGVIPVSGTRAEALTDGILSRPITRYEYLLAAWSARVAVVVVPFLIVMIAAIALVTTLDRPTVPDDTLTFYGVTAALGVVALVLVFQVSLAFMFGIVLRRPLLAIVVLIFIWYPVNGILHSFHLEEFSPMSLNEALPTLLRQPWREVEGDAPEEGLSDAEREALGRRFVSVLSWGRLQEPARPKDDNYYRFESEDFKDFSLARVVLGYGIPTVLAIGLAMLCFCSRDL